MLNAPDPTGLNLEGCIGYLFGSYPGLFKDLGKRIQTGEKDRVIQVLAPPGTVPNAWGDFLYVDCKHESGKDTNSYATDFIGRMQAGRVSHGIAVSPAGFTERGIASARQEVLRGWQQFRLAIGCLSIGELRGCTEEVPWFEVVNEALVVAMHGRSGRSP